MKLAYGNSVSQEFRERVYKIVREYGWTDEHASWLMACMAFESANTFSPSIKNAAGSGATGLIQFMPKTAIGLGTTVEALAQMSAVEQLDWVARYFKPYAKRIKTLPDMYMAILLPSAIGKPDDHPLFDSGKAYRQNAGLDANNNGVITKAEAAAKVVATLTKGLQPPHVYEVKPKENDMSLAGSILTTALPMLLGKLPELATIMKKPDVASRNVELVSQVGGILMQSTGATNVQEAIERVEADPQTAAEANNALRMNRADLVDLMERAWDKDEESVTAARQHSREDPPVAGKWQFVHILSLLLVIFGGAAAGYVLITSEDSTERAMALQTLLIVGFGSVAAFWLGSSRSSQMKDLVK